METSAFIARLIGPFLLVLGLAMLTRPRMIASIIEQSVASTALIFLAGMLALVAGLAIVNVHNVWTADWRVIVTALGWLSIVGGIARMLASDVLARLGRRFAGLRLVNTIAGLLLLVLGVILAGKGYGLGA